MDWNAAIEKNREALKRVLATLVAMAGLVLPRTANTADIRPLPRHLHRAVLRLLRPAESATRRLIIVAARDIVVAPPRRAAPKLHPAPMHPARGSAVRPGSGMCTKKANALLRPRALPLLDPLRCWSHPRRPVAAGVPRISVPGRGAPFPIATRSPPASDDPMNAMRLALRLQALAAALDDLPARARRFACWKASRDAAGAQGSNRDAAGAQGSNRDAAGAQGSNRDAAGAQDKKYDAAGAQDTKYGAVGARTQSLRAARATRIWPLRPGRPPGSLSLRHRRFAHEVHTILDVTHGLAFWALERRDSS